MKNYKNKKLLDMLDMLPDTISNTLKPKLDEVMNSIEKEIERNIKYQNIHAQSIDIPADMSVLLLPYIKGNLDNEKQMNDPMLFVIKPPQNFFDFILKLDKPFRAWLYKADVNRATFAIKPIDTLIWFIQNMKSYQPENWTEFIAYLEEVKNYKEKRQNIPIEGMTINNFTISINKY